jgi:amino acid adenylation domain-containing protein/thioester reductase-like protein
MVDDDRLARLTPAQRKLYQQRLLEKRTAARDVAAADAPNTRCAGPGPHPLSFSQERFWFLDQLEPGSAEYNVTGAARVRGTLDRPALRRALADLVARQSSLRTTLPSVGGRPGQLVHAPEPLEMPVDDLRTLPAAERDTALAARVLDFARTPFDLARGPLFRVLLVMLADDDHVFVVGQHHAVCDGWSVAILVRELSMLYRAHTTGRAAELPPLPVQYADYAAWQRERMAGPRLDASLAHWRSALAGAPSRIELPFDHPRRALSAHAGRTLRWTFEPGSFRAVRELAARERVTPFVLLLASFQAFLSRVTGEEDVVVGTSVANRDRRELENVIGAFVNTLVLRTSCAADPTFRELAARAQTTSRAAFAHAELPFEKLVAELAPSRDPSRTPLFNVYFDMMVPRIRPSWEGLAYEEMPFENGNALFDLSLSIEEIGGRLHAAFEYSTELFEPATIERLRRLYTHFLESAVASPDSRLSSIPVLDAEERALVVDAFNATGLAYDRGDHAHTSMAERARATPDAIALEDGPERITYAELDARANRLAHALIRIGAGPKTRVAVCLPRSIDAIVALYGVWKAGAAYVPLDVEDPPPRWTERLVDVGARALVARAEVTSRLADWPGAKLALEADEAALRAESAQDPAVRLSPETLAYVLYTSGSTGQPKGVMIEHGALANHLAWVRAAFDLAPSDRFLLRTPFTFDASLWEIVHPLACGATLVVARQDTGRDPSLLLELCARARISILQTVPSLLRIWLEEPRFAGLGSLRHLICAGETLDPDLWGRFAATTRELGLRIALHNLYGPSEACIDATWHTLTSRDGGRDLDAVPIGRPISNARAFVLDTRCEPVPIGVVGELWLGGDGLGRGYWNDDELTAQRFVDVVGLGRLYRTGDLARWLADGTLAYVGRADRQLKVNGMRVEPGEIESELRAHADVHDSAVVAIRDATSGLRLQAFVVPVDGRALEPHELRAFLALRLPRYLVPSFLTVLDELPLTTSMKVDLRALQRIAVQSSTALEPGPPRTPTERRIAEMAAALLGLARVGRDDDFFALGGHSLLAAQLVARVRDAWRIELPLVRFFESPTVAALARVVDGSLTGSDPAPSARIPRGSGSVRQLSFAQEGLWAAHELDPDSRLYNVSGGLRLRGDLDAASLESALQCVVDRHGILRSTFEDSEGVPRTRVHVQRVALERRDLSTDPRGAEHALQAFLEAEARHVFDLRRGPLLRAALLRLSDGEHVLALDVHHIVADGWSLELLVDEVARAYAAGVAGKEPDLPPLELKYADWAEFQRSEADGERFAAQIAWWRAALAGAPPRARLPYDRPEHQHASQAGAALDFELDPVLVAALRRYARERRTPVYPVLLAAFAATLRRTGADEDVVIGAVNGMRPRLELERTIGPFVNVLPLRVDLRGSPDFDELVRRAARTTTTAWERAEVPFERIAQALSVARRPGREPFVDVACDLESFPESRAAFPGLTAELVRVDPGTTKLDLSLTFQDDGRTLRGSAQYSTDRFERATIEALVQRFFELLEAALSQPERSIATLPLCSSHAVASDPAWPSAVVRGASGDPEPAGFAGELCSRGDPAGDSRTGLWARITASGRVQVLGRIDEAVEIDGRCVIPSAVESALAEVPGVRAAVVEARATDGGALQLVAHVVPHGLVPLDLARVDAHARGRLAAAWIPSAWRVVEDPPRTRAGAIDRGALARAPSAEFAAVVPPLPLSPRSELEAAVHEHFAEVLQRTGLGVQEDFFALGGSSLAAMRLVAKLRAAFGVDLALGDFYASASIAGVARTIAAVRAGRPRVPAALDLAGEARLGVEFPERVSARWDGPPRRWLLTGSSGFLGAFLLRRLIDGGAESVHCLVRASDDAQGLARIRSNLERYEISTAGLAERVRVVRGDLGEPELGRDPAQRERLANEIDGIVHSGASVNFLADYARLRATNVDGTRALLRIAARRGIPFHHVSTIGVYAPTQDRTRVQREDDPLPDPAGLAWGYERTKWVAEQLVLEACTRGLGVTVHRPGRISGSARSGVWNLDDFAARMVRGCIAVGSAPDLDLRIDMTPVDWVADAIVHLAGSRPRGAAYHLANPRPASFLALFDRLRARGVAVRIVPLAEWFAAVRAAVAGKPDHVLAPLLEMVGAQRDDVAPARLVPDIDLPRLDFANTLRDVVNAGLPCPEIDDALRDRWIDYFGRARAIEFGSARR